MSVSHKHLDSTCKQFVESLLQSKKHHTLCLVIADEGFEGHLAVKAHLEEMGKTVELVDQPTPTAFETLCKGGSDTVPVVHFADLDKSSKCIDALLERVKLEDPGNKLVVVSRHWNARNTEKEREIWRAHSLFYEQAPAR